MLGNIGPRSWSRDPYKTDQGPINSPVCLELARLVSSLLYGTRTMLVLNLSAFENKKYTANDSFHGDSTYGKILNKKEPIRMLGFTLACHIIINNNTQCVTNTTLGSYRYIK